MADAEPLGRFLARTASEELATYLANETPGVDPTAPPLTADEFQKMKAYILDCYRGVTPISSFIDAGGVTIDCIPFDQQPSVRAAKAAAIPIHEAAQPPPSLPEPANPPASPRPKCPSGSVPLTRVALEQLVKSRTLEGFLSKAPPASTGSPGNPPLGVAAKPPGD